MSTLRALALWLALTPAAQAVTVGEAAPESVGAALQGDSAPALADLRGKVVLVDFWASWCAPCLKSLPLYSQLRDELPRTDFEVLAISVDESADDARRFLSAHPVSFPVLHGDPGVPLSWGVEAMPTSYLVDREGIVRAVHHGFQPGDLDALRRQILDLTEKQND